MSKYIKRARLNILSHRWAVLFMVSILYPLPGCGSEGSGSGSDEDAYYDAQGMPEEFERWESQMRRYGAEHFTKFSERVSRFERELPQLKGQATAASLSSVFDQNEPYNHALASSYYDFGRVLYQIADYMRSRGRVDEGAEWDRRAAEAVRFWRDYRVVPLGGRIEGYWNFTDGLLLDYQKTGNKRSKDAALSAAKNAAFARDNTPLSETADDLLSREVAYAIVTYLNAEKLGAPRRERLELLKDQAVGHLRQWFDSSLPKNQRADYVRPFMVALTAHALIRYDDQVGDPAIVGELERAADLIWERCWMAGEQSFSYTDRVGPSPEEDGRPTPDLNLLIAPMYGWLHSQTGLERFRIRGDQIFSGGVRKGYLGGDFAKQFNQAYWWSFEYLKWRVKD